MDTICDICGIRPATRRVQVSQNGRVSELNVCDVDYAKLRQQAGMSSPFESLFSGSDPFAAFDQLAGSASQPRQSRGIQDVISETAKELIQKAG